MAGVTAVVICGTAVVADGTAFVAGIRADPTHGSVSNVTVTASPVNTDH